MSSMTLAQAQLFIHNQIVAGVVQDIMSINPFYAILPFESYTGQAILVNREDALGDANFYSVDATITSKTPTTYEQVPFTATKIIGDVEMDGLVQAQGESDGVSMLATQISSKAKAVGRKFQMGMATGTGTSPAMCSLHSLCAPSQYTAASAGQPISFELLDELLALVKSKDGMVDAILMPGRTLRSYKALLRKLGGTPAEWVVKLPDGRTTIGYEDIPIFANDYLPTTETANGAALTGGDLSSVWALNVDDGTRSIGVSGIHPANIPAGVVVEPIGAMENKDSQLVRVKQYANFVNFNRRGLARLTSINN